MKSLILTTIVTFVTCLSVVGQNYIYSGDNQYEATDSWTFKLNGQYWTENPEFTVAKHSNGGYLMISIKVPFKSHYIGGAVTIFLSDGSTIKCTDKGIRDHVDNKSIALYIFTKTEIELLKQKRITRIRFSIMCGSEGANTFTCDNVKFTSSFYGSRKEKDYFETDVEIIKLFE
jgi:hypothetical protein